jgi:hypothetical protein
VILCKQKAPFRCIQVKRFKEPWQFASKKYIPEIRVLTEIFHNNFNVKLKKCYLMKSCGKKNCLKCPPGT